MQMESGVVRCEVPISDGAAFVIIICFVVFVIGFVMLLPILVTLFERWYDLLRNKGWVKD